MSNNTFTFFPPLPKMAGNLTLIPLSPELTWSDKDGYQLTARYRGLKFDCAYFLSQNRGPGIRSRMIGENDGPYGTVEIIYPSSLDGSDPNNDYQILWFFDGNMLEKDWTTSAAFQGLSAVEQSYLRMGYKQLVDGTTTFAGYLAILSAPLSATALALFTLLAYGTTTYFLPQIVLRRTTIINPLSNRQFMTYVGQYYTTAQLIAIEKPPIVIQTDMPAGGGWYKMAPKKEQQSNGKWIVNEEWWQADSNASVFYSNIPS